MTRNITRSLSLSVAVAALVGCADPQAPGEAPASANPPGYTVLGIDRTAGEAMTREALAIARAYVQAVQPCERLQLRWISDRSFVAGEVIGDLRMPCIANEPPAFDAAGARHYRQAKVAIERTRSDALTAIDRLAAEPPGATRSTDLVGFFAASAANLGDAADYVPALVVISDFEDNAKRSATVNLEGVKVTLHLVGNQVDPARAQAVTSAWGEALEAMGAASVRLASEAPSR